MTSKTPRPPVGLGPRGRRFWRSTIADYELTEGELEVLAEAARTLDDLDRLAAAIAEHGAMTTGSQGQPVVNPALTEARGQRAVLHRLLAALALPDDDGKAIPTSTTTRSQTAARARWRGHTRVAG
jgi:hypothetical protein